MRKLKLCGEWVINVLRIKQEAGIQVSALWDLSDYKAVAQF